MGNSTGIAPSFLKRSLSAPACLLARVTRMRLPCRGNDVLLLAGSCAQGVSRMLLLPCSVYIHSGDNPSGTLPQCLLCQFHSKLLGKLNCGALRPAHTLTQAYLELPIQADYESPERQHFTGDLPIGGNRQVAASP